MLSSQQYVNENSALIRIKQNKTANNLRNGNHVLDTTFANFFSSLQTAQVGQRERLRL